MAEATTKKPDGEATQTPNAGKPAADKAKPETSDQDADERLDEALEETFPSSDPVSVKITK